jgi:hypothetical protein
LFNKKNWSVWQVHHAAAALLPSIVQEHKMLQEIPNLMAPEAVLAVVVHVPVVASLPAGPKVYSDVSYNQRWLAKRLQ